MLNTEDFSALANYLCKHRLAADPESLRISPLGGGVSSVVLLIESDCGRFVLKQALQKLKVETDWRADLDRAMVEMDALRFLPTLHAGETPRLVHSDEENFLFVMEAAPPGFVNWKERLMQGELNPAAALALGDFLGKVHARTWENSEAGKLFAEKKYFRQLRLDPFFNYLKHRYPELCGQIDGHVEDCGHRAETLVLGDFSPKNILVQNADIIPIDFEIVHVGDPSFDLGFMTSHLLLKSIHYRQRISEFHALLLGFARQYLGWVDFIPDMEARAVRQLAFLLLARMDGKSPVPYIQDEKVKNFIRERAMAILNHEMTEFSEVLRDTVTHLHTL